MCVPNAENSRSRRGRGVTPSQQTVRATITHGVVNRIFNALRARQLLRPISPASSVGLNLPWDRHTTASRLSGQITCPPFQNGFFASLVYGLPLPHFGSLFPMCWFHRTLRYRSLAEGTPNKQGLIVIG